MGLILFCGLCFREDASALCHEANPEETAMSQRGRLGLASPPPAANP